MNKNKDNINILNIDVVGLYLTPAYMIIHIDFIFIIDNDQKLCRVNITRDTTFKFKILSYRPPRMNNEKENLEILYNKIQLYFDNINVVGNMSFYNKLNKYINSINKLIKNKNNGKVYKYKGW